MIEREYLVAGMQVREHRLDVPLNWFDASDPRRISIFARELSIAGRNADGLPCLLFLQGGREVNVRVQPARAGGSLKR